MAVCSGNPCTCIIRSVAVEAVTSTEKYITERENVPVGGCGFGGGG